MAAIAGLVGVLIGGLVTGLTAYLMTRRAEIYERLAGRRLLAADLYKAIAVSAFVREHGLLGPERGPLNLQGYDDYAGTLARHLSVDDWNLVRGSVLGVRRLDAILVELETENRELTSEEAADFGRIAIWLEKTVAVLEDPA